MQLQDAKNKVERERDARQREAERATEREPEKERERLRESKYSVVLCGGVAALA